MFTYYLDPSSARRLALWRVVFVWQEGALTDEEWRERSLREEQEAETRAESAWLTYAERSTTESELDLADDDANGFAAWGFGPDAFDPRLDGPEYCRTCGELECYRPEGHPLDEHDEFNPLYDREFGERHWLETHPLR